MNYKGKKRKVGIITSQLNINRHRDKRKGAACRNLQEIRVFSDFLPPPCGLGGLRSSACTGTGSNLHYLLGGISSPRQTQSSLMM